MNTSIDWSKSYWLPASVIHVDQVHLSVNDEAFHWAKEEDGDA